MIHLISGNFGPFEPEFPIELPLWAAIMLKKQKKCRLIPPNWMKDVWFIEKIKQEKFDFAEDIPFYYQEIFMVFNLYAQEDVKGFSKILCLMTELVYVREKKLTNFLKKTNQRTLAFMVKNLCQFEITSIYHHLTIVNKLFWEWQEQKDWQLKVKKQNNY